MRGSIEDQPSSNANPDNDSSYKYIFKVIIVGEHSVGKTCLFRQFTDAAFTHQTRATVGVDFKVKTVIDGQDKIKLQLWDTSGLERFRSITASYFRNARAIILVYDISWYRSFENLATWLAEIERYADHPVLKVLVGNKLDLDAHRRVSLGDGKNFVKQNFFDYFIETSALDSTNVERLFMEITRRLNKMEDQIDRRYLNGTPSVNPTVHLNEGQNSHVKKKTILQRIRKLC